MIRPVSNAAAATRRLAATVVARMAASERLRPGEKAVVERFFHVLEARGERYDAPSRQSFDAAARSEPTLATLLRGLATHAPEVCLAPGRAARRAWYRRRPKRQDPARRGPLPLRETAPEHWPAAWASLYPALRAASVRESSKRRYIASVDRCAAALGRTDAEADWSRYSAYCLFEQFIEEGVRPRTVANYLEGLRALGRHGGLVGDRLAGLAEMRQHALTRAGMMEKLKVARVEHLFDRGGLPEIVRTVAALGDRAAGLPAWGAEAERCRQQAAILAVEINAWGRAGDVAGWILDRDLVRDPSGDWRLSWVQGKTGRRQQIGMLWPEIGAVLDDLLLAGRPYRLVGQRYRDLAGTHWLTHGAPPPAKWPSLLARDALGLPLHDLRTVIADQLRQLDPGRAEGLVRTLLGHADPRATTEYRALCAGEAAMRDWQRIRERIGRSRKAEG